MRWKQYRTDPLTVYEAGLGWQRISSMVMVREVYEFFGLRVPASRWRPWEEKTVMYVHDGVWHQPADVERRGAQPEASTASEGGSDG